MLTKDTHTYTHTHTPHSSSIDCQLWIKTVCNDYGRVRLLCNDYGGVRQCNDYDGVRLYAMIMME